MKAKKVNENNFEKGQDPKRSMRIGNLEKSDMKRGADAFTHWLYNVNAKDMLDKVWNGWQHMEEKLKNKIGNVGYLDPNSLMKFVRDLDKENLDKLYDYIIENHSDKW